MIRWILSWLWEMGWYALVVSGWLCWFKAHQRARQLDHELTVMAQSWRYASRKERV